MEFFKFKYLFRNNLVTGTTIAVGLPFIIGIPLTYYAFKGFASKSAVYEGVAELKWRKDLLKENNNNSVNLASILNSKLAHPILLNTEVVSPIHYVDSEVHTKKNNVVTILKQVKIPDFTDSIAKKHLAKGFNYEQSVAINDLRALQRRIPDEYYREANKPLPLSKLSRDAKKEESEWKRKLSDSNVQKRLVELSKLGDAAYSRQSAELFLNGESTSDQASRDELHAAFVDASTKLAEVFKSDELLLSLIKELEAHPSADLSLKVAERERLLASNVTALFPALQRDLSKYYNNQ